MRTVVVVGTQWGDEGKGKVTDLLAEKADLVVRFQGGNNAGHTIAIGDKVYKLHLVPSGIFNPGTACVIGSGMVVDPAVLLKEIDGIEKAGIDTGNLYLSDRAHVIMPYHRVLDRLEEEKRSQKIGTTGRGIGPAYLDKVSRAGIRLGELVVGTEFKRKLEGVLPEKNKIITGIYGGAPLVLEEILEEYREYARALAGRVTDTSLLVNQAVDAGKAVLFEGAQGTMLDLDYGTYPFVTSSNTAAGAVCTGAGIGPGKVRQVLGVIKAYTTRVGEGPFPTEVLGGLADGLRESGGEYGTTTGRPRRIGWLDGVILRLACRLNGLTAGVITKLDVLSGLEEIKVCTGYRYQGRYLEEWPASLEVLSACQPVYESLEGWSQDLSGIHRYQDFPAPARDYVQRVSEITGLEIPIVSVGPRRDQTKILQEITF